jgi:hypothetical protein
MRARWHVARETVSMLVVPWCVAAEAGRRLDAQGRAELQAALSAPMVVIAPRDAASALACAQMASQDDRQPGWDAAQVVYEASHRGWPVVTDEQHLDRLLSLDSGLLFERLP